MPFGHSDDSLCTKFFFAFLTLNSCCDITQALEFKSMEVAIIFAIGFIYMLEL